MDNLKFELTNEDRKYLGLEPVQDNWERVKLSDTTYLYFEGNTIKKYIYISNYDYYLEARHYCLVVVDGRQRGYSLGLEMTELSKLMKQLGCTEAYNLDGGMTAMMAYGTELYSQPCGGGRQNCDIVYVAEPLS